MEKSKIEALSDNPAIDVAIDTVKKDKQALVFCNTRRSAEACAEKIAGKIKTESKELADISDSVLHALSTPTKQCRRLSLCIKKGTAFHHAGLAAKQRELIEDNFRSGKIRVICSTPTLAFGVNLPAFRSIIKDLKRYGGRWGLDWIPTLEYHQMAGRAGRPDFNDKFGEAICIAGNEREKEDIINKYINASPESIFSKLAVEPVLRTYCLSLVSVGFCNSKNDLLRFFEKTFYGKQYGDMKEVENKISKVIGLLEEWNFIELKNSSNDFVSASDIESEKIVATKLGERVAQLYIDPFTAFYIITALQRATQKLVNEFSFLSMACSTLELRPLPNVRVSEFENVEAKLSELSSGLIILEPNVFESEYDEFLKAIKLSLSLSDWMDEKDEEFILENYNVAPGELHLKRGLCDWILYSAEELAQILGFNDIIKVIRKARFRLDKGIKEELIPLVRIPNIGRVRARLLFRNGIKDIGDIKTADLTRLKQLLGDKTALNLKKDVGMDLEKDFVPEGRRKGQLSVEKY